MGNNSDSLPAHWVDSWYDDYKAEFESGDFEAASQTALEGAIEASRRYRVSEDLEDLLHRAFLYAISAIAARKGMLDDRLLHMYFMSRLAIKEIGPLPDSLPDAYKESLHELESDLDGFKTRIADLNVDPDMDPMVFMKTQMALNRG